MDPGYNLIISPAHFYEFQETNQESILNWEMSRMIYINRI